MKVESTAQPGREMWLSAELDSGPVGQHGREDDGADDHGLQVRVDVQERQAVAAPPSEGRARRWRPIDLWASIGPVAVFVLLFALVAVLRAAFLGGGGLAILATQATAILLVGLGQGMVLHVGLDRPVQRAIALFGCDRAGQVDRVDGRRRMVLVSWSGTLIGALNGFLMAFFQVPELRVDARDAWYAAGRVTGRQ